MSSTSRIVALYIAVIICSAIGSCESFTAALKILTSPSAISLRLSGLNEQDDVDAEKKVEFKSSNPLELAAWYGVEAFGKVFRQANNAKKDFGNLDIDLTKPPTSMKETLARIQLDNDRYYFLSGEVDRLIYDKDCVFADPFVSFDGKLESQLILVILL